ncbi:MAG TPA: hypothetical protein VN108_11830 [Marmoricola sp.]|nr:hypothetical protein [Marmoricola sp.]
MPLDRQPCLPQGAVTALSLLAELSRTPAADFRDNAVVEFSEQFSLDVSSMDASQRKAFFDATGERAFEVAQQIYVHDMAPRIRSVLKAVIDLDLPAPSNTVPAGGFWGAIEAFMVAVGRLDNLDPGLTEVVRLRGARLHDCAVCKSRRSIDALETGSTEAEFTAIDYWPRSDLPARTKAALGLVDAMVFTPHDLPQSVINEARRQLSETEIVEVLLDVVRNAANKIAVALGADAATVTEGVELFTTDSDGNVLVI